MARKPLVGTVAANVLEYGTGAINVDACRVGTEDVLVNTYQDRSLQWGVGTSGNKAPYKGAVHQGRWPANVLHDGSEDVLAGFPVTTPSKSGGKSGCNANPMSWGEQNPDRERVGHDDAGGSAARFFYCAKASKKDRDEGCEELPERLTMRYGEKEQGPLPQQTPSRPTPQRNHHPTVKPTALMRYLCRLVTPPNGIILDPFMGSGSTGKAAVQECFRFIGIELDPDYFEIARRRIEHAERIPVQVGLEV